MHFDETTLARMIYEEQIKNDWPGLGKEAKSISNRLKIDDANKTNFTKVEYKDIVKKACRREDAIMLRNSMEGKTKTKDLVSESCNVKDYFRSKSLSVTRDIFRIRSSMNPLKGNFKQMYRNSPGGVLCAACGEEEEVNSHVMSCGDYADLRQGKDFKNNIDLVNYFREVMARRDQPSS